MFIIDWITNNLEIVIPIAAAIVILIIYKIRSDSKNQEQKDRLAGLQEGRRAGRRDHHHHRRKGKHGKKHKNRDRDRHHEREELIRKEKDKNKKKDKKKRKHKKNKKDYAAEEQDVLAAEFGAIKKSGLDDGSPIRALIMDDPMGENLPPNWSVQYYDNGTLFYFNSLTNEVSMKRPR